MWGGFTSTLTTQSDTMNSRARGITSSLNKLGIPVTTGQWVGAICAVLAGIILARLMPYIYPIVFARLLDFIFGPGPSSFRDGFNSFLMTACTCTTSFVISFFAFILFRSKRNTGG